MSKNHWIGILITCVYLFVVGFAEFPPKDLEDTYGNSVKLVPIASPKPVVSLNTEKASMSYEEHTEMNRMAKAISSKYRRIDYVTAMKLMTTVYDIAKESKQDPKLILAIIATESSFNAKALSRRDAAGYLQVIPKWHRDKIKGRNIWNMEVNIEVGVKILNDCRRKYSSLRNALGCYNGAVRDEDKDVYYVAVLNNKRQLHYASTRTTL